MAESQVSGLIEQVQLGATAHSIASTAYGICDSSASTPGKEVNMTGFDLKPGVTVHIKFINENTAESPTLSISGSIAKPLAITNWAPNSILSLTYDNISDTWIYNTSGKVPFESLPTGTSASTVAIGNHTHGLGNLTTVALGSKTALDGHHATAIIRSSSSQLFFGGSGSTNKIDFIGLQLRGSNDEFQLVSETQLAADRNTLLFRQNDNASPNANNWGTWQQLVHTNYINRVGGAGDSGSKEEGSEAVATPVYITTSGTATPIAYTIGSDVPIGAVFTDTNQYHKTGSWNGLTYTADAVNNADELAFTIPTGTSSTTVAAGDHNHNLTYLKLDGSNNMSGDVNIIAGDTDKFVNFWYNTGKKAGASWRIGMLGSGSSDTNYFVIQSGTSTVSATNWNDVFRIGQNTFNIYIPSTTASTSTSTGALTVGGGLGVAGQVTATSLHGTLATTDLSGIVTTTAKKFLKDTGTWTQVDWGDLTNVPNTFAPSAHEHNYIGKDGFIAYPSDGCCTTSSTTVGYIKIKIPQTKSQTMFTFDVDIYNYMTSTSTRYHIGGYNYNNASWKNCTAYCIAPLSNAQANLTVRFLSNGDDEMYATIGETDTNWDHPQITIHNIAISYNNQATLEKWKSGWTITIDSTAFDNSLVKQTITNTNIAYTAENVTGTVAIANGGTGATTANAAANALLSGLPDWTANPSDDVKLIRRDTSGTATFGQIKFSTVWNYIKSKTDTLYVTKSTGVTDIAWDSNNAKLTKTINGTTTDIVTAATLKSAINVTAADLGLSSALRYQGTTTTAMEDGRTTAAVTIGGNSFTPTQGDVVIYNDAEYLWTGNLWELIGAESSFKKVQTAVNTSSASGSSATTFVSSVTQDTQGVITVKTSTLNTSGTWSGTASKATTAADTSSTLYIVGVASGATSTLKHDTSVTVKGGAVSATAYNGLTLTAASTGFTIAGGTTSKTLTVSDTLTLKTGTANYVAYYSAAGTISGHSQAHFSDTWSSSTKNGKNELVLGNNIASTSNGSAYGQLALYSESTAGTYLKSEPGTSWTTASLQAKTGTIALMSDVTESKVEIIRFV